MNPYEICGLVASSFGSSPPTGFAAVPSFLSVDGTMYKEVGGMYPPYRTVQSPYYSCPIFGWAGSRPCRGSLTHEKNSAPVQCSEDETAENVLLDYCAVIAPDMRQPLKNVVSKATPGNHESFSSSAVWPKKARGESHDEHIGRAPGQELAQDPRHRSLSVSLRLYVCTFVCMCVHVCVHVCICVLLSLLLNTIIKLATGKKGKTWPESFLNRKVLSATATATAQATTTSTTTTTAKVTQDGR